MSCACTISELYRAYHLALHLRNQSRTNSHIRFSCLMIFVADQAHVYSDAKREQDVESRWKREFDEKLKHHSEAKRMLEQAEETRRKESIEARGKPLVAVDVRNEWFGILCRQCQIPDGVQFMNEDDAQLNQMEAETSLKQEVFEANGKQIKTIGGAASSAVDQLPHADTLSALDSMIGSGMHGPLSATPSFTASAFVESKASVAIVDCSTELDGDEIGDDVVS